MEKKKEENFIFGIRAIIEAVKAGKEIEKVLLKKDSQGVLVLELLKILSENKIPVQYVPLERINKYTRKNHQGAIAFVSPISYHNIEQLLPTVFEAGKDPFVLVLDSVTDVRNFGAMARTAECVGVDAILIADKGSAPVNSDAIKTSAGALNKIPVCRVRSLMKAVTFLQQSGLKVVAATEKSDEDYYNTDLKGPIALIMGAEDKGVSRDLLKVVDKSLKIPVVGDIESLNVSVAAGVLMYEVLKQNK